MAEESAEQTATPESGGAQAQESRSGDATLGKRHRILVDSPLDELSTPWARAYAVADGTGGEQSRLFARILAPDAIPRLQVMMQLRQLKEAHVMRPMDWGAITLPGDKHQSFGVIFERPAGPPLFPALEKGGSVTPSAELAAGVMHSIIRSLGVLARRSVTHRAIRPDNLFLSVDDEKQILLGDCVTAAPGSTQSVIYEPVELATASPQGRGSGKVADDLYALGATLLTIALGRCPLAGLSDNEIIETKILKGSFVALLGGERVPFGLREPLRALLNDNPRDRWGLDELEQWVRNNVSRTSRSEQDVRIDRPYPFKGTEHRNYRSLAYAFSKDWRQAYSAIIDGQFDKWFQRGTRDPELVRTANSMIEDSGKDVATTKGADGRLVFRICQLMDPVGPMRFKGINVMPDGLGARLAQAIREDDREDVQSIAELILKSLPVEWYELAITSEHMDVDVLGKHFRRIRQLLRQSPPGYGIERCLYELNPSLPCLSRTVSDYYVDSISDLLPSLEDVVSTQGKLPSIVDRHMAAFIASRVRTSMDRDLQALEGTQGGTAGAQLAMIRILATLQRDFGPESLPNLTAWLADTIKPTLKIFASQTLRAQIARTLETVADSGHIWEVHGAINNEALLRRDKMALRQATERFNRNRNRIMELQAGRYRNTAEYVGWRLASGAAGVAALGSALVVLIV